MFFSNILEIEGRILTGLYLFFFVFFSSFLCAGIMSANLRESGKATLDIDSLHISVMNGEIISLFSTSNRVGILLKVVGFFYQVS